MVADTINRLDLRRLGIKIHRILIIFWGHFGETLVTTPLLASLRKKFPGAYITYILGGSGHYLFEHASKILDNNPNLDQYIKSDETILHKLCLRKPYDLVLDLCGGKFSTLICRVSGAKLRVWGRFREGPTELFYSYYRQGKWSKSIRISLKKNNSKIEHFLSIAHLFGIDTSAISLPKIYLSKEERRFCLEYLDSIKNKKKSPIIGLHPGGRNPQRLWSPENYALLADKLIEKLRVKVIVFAGPGEKTIADRVYDLANNKLIKVTKKNLRRYLAIISGCNIFISTDGGPLHIALALRIPSVGIFKNKENIAYWYKPYKQSGLLSTVIAARSFDTVNDAFGKVKILLKSNKN